MAPVTRSQRSASEDGTAATAATSSGAAPVAAAASPTSKGTSGSSVFAAEVTQQVTLVLLPLFSQLTAAITSAMSAAAGGGSAAPSAAAAAAASPSGAASPPAAAAPSPTPTPGPTIKPPPYEHFSGTGPDSKPHSWLAGAELWLHAQRYDVSSPTFDHAYTISVVASYFTGAARAWWTTLQPKPATWAAFKAAVITMFNPLGAEQTAREKLDKLRQLTVGGCLAYTTEFTTLAATIPGFSPAEMLHRYRSGLHPVVAAAVLQHGDATTTFAEVRDRALRVDTVMRRHNDVASSSAGPSATKPKSQPSYNKAGNNKPKPAAAPAANPAATRALYSTVTAPASAPSPPLQKLSDEEREVLRAANGCFRCRQAGHTSKECPLNKSVGNGRRQ